MFDGQEAVGGWQSTAAMVYNYAINGELQDIAEAAQEGMFEKLVLLDVLSSYTDISYQDSTSFDMAVDAFKEFVNVRAAWMTYWRRCRIRIWKACSRRLFPSNCFHGHQPL